MLSVKRYLFGFVRAVGILAFPMEGYSPNGFDHPHVGTAVPLILSRGEPGFTQASLAGVVFRCPSILVEHGQWKRWIKRNFELSYTSAQRYIQLVKEDQKKARALFFIAQNGRTRSFSSVERRSRSTPPRASRAGGSESPSTASGVMPGVTNRHCLPLRFLAKRDHLYTSFERWHYITCSMISAGFNSLCGSLPRWLRTWKVEYGRLESFYKNRKRRSLMAQTHEYKVIQKPVSTMEAELNKIAAQDYTLVNIFPMPNGNLVAVMQKPI